MAAITFGDLAVLEMVSDLLGARQERRNVLASIGLLDEHGPGMVALAFQSRDGFRVALTAGQNQGHQDNQQGKSAEHRLILT